IEEVAFQKQDRARADQVGVDVARRQKGGGAEIGAHRTLTVWGHGDETTRRAGLAFARRGIEGDAGGAKFAREPRAQIVVSDLADIAGGAAEAGNPRRRVGGRTAGRERGAVEKLR